MLGMHRDIRMHLPGSQLSMVVQEGVLLCEAEAVLAEQGRD